MAVHAGSVFVDVRPDTTGFTTALNAQMASTATTVGRTFSQKLTRASSGLRTVGKSLTRYVSVPLVGIGAVATKMALDFDKAFTEISAVTNTSQKQVAEWRKQVLALAGTTAQSPQELANALYFLASAGLETSQVMEVLESSAQASAAGLGETADIARLSANVLNAYPKTVTNAAEAIDVLVAAVKVGTAEPDEFADSLGRILPIASKAGVGFDEVSASLASLSNIGLDVNEGVTAMRGVLQALVAPGSEAAETLKELGLSADDVRTSLSEDGLLATLDLLEEKSHGQIDVLQDLIPNVRALTGFFGLTEQEATKVAAAFDQVTNSKGELDKAFGKTKRGAAFQFEQTLAELQAAGIKLGNQIIPILVEDVIPAIRDAVKWFSKLSPETKTLAVQLGVLAAVAGPLASLASVFVRMGAGLAKLVPWLIKWPKGPFPMPGTGPGGVPVGGVPGVGGVPLPAPPPVMLPGGVPLGSGGSPKGGGLAVTYNVLLELDAAQYIDELKSMGVTEENVRTTTEALNNTMMLQGESIRFTEAEVARLAGSTGKLDFSTINNNVEALTERYRDLTGHGLRPATQELVDNAVAQGRVAAAAGIVRNQIQFAEKAVNKQSRAVSKNADAAAEADRNQRQLAGSTKKSGDEANTSAGKFDNLTSRVERVPKGVKVNVDTPGLDTSITQTQQLANLLAGLQQTYTARVEVIQGHTGGLVRHAGGIIPRMHAGGVRPDERMALLQAGEYVMRREAVGRIGIDALTALNRGSGPGGSQGGPLEIRGRMEFTNWGAGRKAIHADIVWANSMRGW